MPFWWDYVLAGLGAPDAPVSITCLQLWAQSEGMPGWENNWLATTEQGFGGHQVNSAGVMAYPTVQDGANATVATLLNGNYGAVVADFRNQASLSVFLRDINLSPWCHGCQGGHYPVALWDYVMSNFGGGSVAVGGTGGTTPPIAAAPIDGRIATQISYNDWMRYMTVENPQHAAAAQWLANVLNTL